MEYRKLGRTDLEVSALCLGTMTWGEQNSESEGHAQIERAKASGINFIDTAEMYPVPPRAETYSRTEQIIGSYFKQQGDRAELDAPFERGARVALARQRQQQGDPAAHRRSDRDDRAVQAVDQGDGVLAPAADRGLSPVAGRPAMGEMVVADEGPASLARRFVQRQGLGSLHVRAEAADPDDGRAGAVHAPIGQGFAVGAGEVLKVGHGPLVPRPAVRVTLDPAARWRN